MENCFKNHKETFHNDFGLKSDLKNLTSTAFELEKNAVFFWGELFWF